MCTQRPFTSQVISKIYFLTFASYIEKLPETAIKSLITLPLDFTACQIPLHLDFVHLTSENHILLSKSNNP